MERNFLVDGFECWDIYTVTVSQGGNIKCKSSVRMNFSVVTALGQWQGLGRSLKRPVLSWGWQTGEPWSRGSRFNSLPGLHFCSDCKSGCICWIQYVKMCSAGEMCSCGEQFQGW